MKLSLGQSLWTRSWTGECASASNASAFGVLLSECCVAPPFIIELTTRTLPLVQAKADGIKKALATANEE